MQCIFYGRLWEKHSAVLWGSRVRKINTFWKIALGELLSPGSDGMLDHVTSSYHVSVTVHYELGLFGSSNGNDTSGTNHKQVQRGHVSNMSQSPLPTAFAAVPLHFTLQETKEEKHASLIYRWAVSVCGCKLKTDSSCIINSLSLGLWWEKRGKKSS